MTNEVVAFTAYVSVGLAGALAFVLLYAIHPMTRKTWWRGSVGQNLMAYSVVMVLIYTQGVINRLLPDWSWLTHTRVGLGLFAIVVVWWRLFLLIGEIKKWKKARRK
jgi:hypothetical protein